MVLRLDLNPANTLFGASPGNSRPTRIKKHAADIGEFEAAKIKAKNALSSERHHLDMSFDICSGTRQRFSVSFPT